MTDMRINVTLTAYGPELSLFFPYHSEASAIASLIERHTEHKLVTVECVNDGHLLRVGERYVYAVDIAAAAAKREASA